MVRLGGHVAYGSLDQKVKYGGTMEYMFNTNPRIMFMGSYYHDVRQLGKSANAFLDDNIMTTLLRRNPNYKLTLVDQVNLEFMREWYQGFSNTLTLRHQVIYPTGYVPFQIQDMDQGPLTSSEITLNLHYGYREKFLTAFFERIV